MGPDTERNIQSIRNQANAAQEIANIAKDIATEALEKVKKFGKKLDDHVEVEDQAEAAYWATRKAKSKNFYNGE